MTILFHRMEHGSARGLGICNVNWSRFSNQYIINPSWKYTLFCEGVPEKTTRHCEPRGSNAGWWSNPAHEGETAQGWIEKRRR